MTGVFDSGRGGLYALSHLRRLKPMEDIIFFADEANAPYGTKSESELTELVSADIERLLSAGARRVLIACCTASTVYERLDARLRELSLPIIEPTAERAVKSSRSHRIGVLSTEATKRSLAFVRAVKKFCPEAEVLSVSAPELVSLAEGGAEDGALTAKEKKIIEKTISPVKDFGADTLILGCTHFAYFEREIENILGVEIVNSAKVGAEEMAKITSGEGVGATVYIS